MSPPSVIERAFQLAASGECATLWEIRRRLVAEGYDRVDSHVRGQQLSRSLRLGDQRGQKRASGDAI